MEEVLTYMDGKSDKHRTRAIIDLDGKNMIYLTKKMYLIFCHFYKMKFTDLQLLIIEVCVIRLNFQMEKYIRRVENDKYV